MSKPKHPRIKISRYGTWWVHYTENGRSQRQSLGTKDQKEAESRLAGWIDQRELEQLMCDDPTITLVLEIWYNDWVEGRQNSEDRTRSIIKNLDQYFGKMLVSQVLQKHSKEYIKLRKQGIIGTKKAVEGTIRLELIKLRAALNYMVNKVEPKERRIEKSLLPYIFLPPESDARNRVLTREELQLISDYCMEDGARTGSIHQGPDGWITREARFCILAMETAARKSALLELTWDQVHWDRGTLHLNPDGRRQTSKFRPTIPMSDKLILLLNKVYPFRKNNLILDSKTSIFHGLNRIMDDLGIENVTPHVFRHTFATHRIEAGADIGKVAKFMGDHPETVRRNYEHLAPDYLRDIINTDQKLTAHSVLLPS